MLGEPNHVLWAVMGLLAFALVTAVMGTLAKWTHHNIHRHDLVVQSKLKRREYMKAMVAKHSTEAEG